MELNARNVIIDKEARNPARPNVVRAGTDADYSSRIFVQFKKFEWRLIYESHTSSVNYKKYGSKKVLAKFCRTYE